MFASAGLQIPYIISNICLGTRSFCVCRGVCLCTATATATFPCASWQIACLCNPFHRHRRVVPSAAAATRLTSRGTRASLRGPVALARSVATVVVTSLRSSTCAVCGVRVREPVATASARTHTHREYLPDCMHCRHSRATHALLFGQPLAVVACACPPETHSRSRIITPIV